jgi:hypothetical protein
VIGRRNCVSCMRAEGSTGRKNDDRKAHLGLSRDRRKLGVGMSLGPADGGSLGSERGNRPRTSGNSEWRQQHGGLWLFSGEIQNMHTVGFPGCRTRQRSRHDGEAGDGVDSNRTGVGFLRRPAMAEQHRDQKREDKGHLRLLHLDAEISSGSRTPVGLQTACTAVAAVCSSARSRATEIEANASPGCVDRKERARRSWRTYWKAR